MTRKLRALGGTGWNGRWSFGVWAPGIFLVLLKVKIFSKAFALKKCLFYFHFEIWSTRLLKQIQVFGDST